MAYNCQDLDLLIRAIMAAVLDEEVVSQGQLKHHVRRVTLGGQETCSSVHLIIEELKGQVGLDESGVSLLKSWYDSTHVEVRTRMLKVIYVLNDHRSPHDCFVCD